MTSASELRSGKGDRDENFPVASWIIHPRHRALILAFTISSAPPTTSPTTRRCRRTRSSPISTCSRRNCSARATPRPKRSPAARARRARHGAAPRARRAHRVPHGRDQAALRELGRGDPLLPLFGDAGRPLHARRPWREHLDLGRVGCALRGAADQQPPAGLRQGFPRAQPRLSAARCAGRERRLGRAARAGAVAAGDAGLPSGARRAQRSAARRGQVARARRSGISASASTSR